MLLKCLNQLADKHRWPTGVNSRDRVQFGCELLDIPFEVVLDFGYAGIF